MSLPRPAPPAVRTTRSRPRGPGAFGLARRLVSLEGAAMAAALALPLLGTVLLLAGRAAAGEPVAPGIGLRAVLLVVALGAAWAALALRGKEGDPLLLPLAAALAGTGFVLQAGLGHHGSFVQGVALGAAAMVGASLLADRTILGEGAGGRPAYVWLPLLAALTLSAALLLFGEGPGRSGAKVNLLGAQPIEVIRLLVALSLAGWFGRRWRLLRDLDEPALHPRLSFLRLPRLDEAGPVALAVAVTLVFFVLQRDLGPALLLIGVFLVLYAVCRRHVALAAAALAVVVAGFAVADRLGVPATVKTRVAMWVSPWENGVNDQLAHALWGFAAGGVTGTGPGLGAPGEIPAVHTDLVLAAAGEELGLVGLLCLGGLYALLVARGLRAARRAPDASASLLALALTAGLALQVLLIAGGALGVVPLSGVVTPFLSFGRSALVVHFASLGILWSIAATGRRPAPARPAGPRTTTLGAPLPPAPADAFASSLKGVAAVLAACAAVVLGKAVWVQGVRADDVLARPVLVRQADGHLRFADDPRLRRVADGIPRGSILDRNGLPLATSSWEELTRHRDGYARLGLDLERAVLREDARHYPLGGATWHLLGDLRTGAGWGAPNTSLVERDAQAVLAGWDDRRATVEVTDPRTGDRVAVERRDLRELVPLWRHRRSPGHPDARAILDRPREVRTTFDAGLQLRAAQALDAVLESRNLRGGAVVVLDAETGDLLASVTAPRPAGALRGERATPAPETLLDRARYGSYPPGSTFKIVTALAALRKDPTLAGATFRCAPLGNGRAGAVVAGRTVRDHRSASAHGTLGLSDAIVHSCNAYFAQLGREVGFDAIEAAARPFGIGVGTASSPARKRAHAVDAAFGQGAVTATPLEMARAAAAIAAHGVLHPPRWNAGEEREHEPSDVVSAGAARTIGAAMRAAVVRGTGRRLAGHRVPMAGKTGTAEAGTGESHAWFAGYAPHGGQGRRIAFAVLLERGGAGGDAAAELAGEVVSAAAERGLLAEGDAP